MFFENRALLWRYKEDLDSSEETQLVEYIIFIIGEGFLQITRLLVPFVPSVEDIERMRKRVSGRARLC